MSFQDQNKRILEKKLVGLIREMCQNTQIGFADWDLGEELANAIKNSEHYKVKSSVCTAYNAQYSNAVALKVNLEDHFKFFVHHHPNKTDKPN